MKKKFLIALTLLFIAGCIPSQIKIAPRKGDDSRSMYGSTPGREFISNESPGDSLVELWEYSTNGSFPSNAVTVYDSFAFVNDLSGRIYCIHIYTGKRLGQIKNKGCVYSAPVINRNSLIYVSAITGEDESNVVFYDYINGQIKDETIVDGLMITELIKVEDGVLFTTENGKVYKFNFIGQKVWELDTKTSTRSIPSADETYLLFANDEGELICIDHTKGTIKYKIIIGEPVFSGSAISGKNFYLSDNSGVVYKFDISSGKILNRFDSGARILMSPSIQNDNLYIGNLRGELFSLSTGDLSLNWKLKTDGVLNASPLVTENKLVVPDLNRRIFYVNKFSGSLERTFEIDGRVKHTPVIVDGKLLVGYDSGILKAYEITN
ncbi:MAG: PQQ-binding-like beta-propeller repeat protein [Ignavibacteriales bacterium]|nr:MAG: PQQ-binding-like beta-propeller repeat protein [Ignavibacteriales bacterium]